MLIIIICGLNLLTRQVSFVSVEAEVVTPAVPGAVGVSGKGDAVASLVQEVPSMLERMQAFLLVGGPVVWVLMVFSIIALSIVLIKLWQFAVLRPESQRDVKQSLTLWRKGEYPEAQRALQAKRPVSELVLIAMQGLSSAQIDMNLLKDELDRVAALRLNQLRALLRPLEVIAMLSPLLGLLGTVLGMIGAFQQMEAAGNQVDPSVLSGGIWQALLTTAVGLVVAIPVVAIHSWLERKVERVAALMSDSVTQVFTGYQSSAAVLAEHGDLDGALNGELKRAA